MSIYAAKQQQIAWRKYLDEIDFTNSYAITLTYSDTGLSETRREATHSAGYSNPIERFRTALTSNLDNYLHRLNKHIFKNAFLRYGKRLKCFPVIEGNGIEKREHFHLALWKPEWMDDFSFEAITDLFWLKGDIDFQKETKGYWKDYITKLYSKDYTLESFSDSVIVDLITL